MKVVNIYNLKIEIYDNTFLDFLLSPKNLLLNFMFLSDCLYLEQLNIHSFVCNHKVTKFNKIKYNKITLTIYKILILKTPR